MTVFSPAENKSNLHLDENAIDKNADGENVTF